jgi:DNA invertase Pin-like site-specific DNA recombinase/AraC-like DNA-binding protein
MARRLNGAERRRCAVYTRKSSEEGLQQDFNSLDAQREACEAFIRSQKHEGWTTLPEMYDDGGVSGATMNRPALRRLLTDIAAGHVDMIVVYKIDRLTRSLNDFAKIVEVFDKHGISFVSVTQQFNTTTSMGRLTLNMLLSFAQFEREVTGERIRDKIAASKKKGLWMGGLPPMGYDVDERKLVVNQQEAETVCQIYDRYVALGSVRTLKEELDRDGIVSKARIDRYGRQSGGKPLARGALYWMLRNRIYRGEIVHKEKSYPGQHTAIICDQLWNQVQARLATNRTESANRTHAKETSLLAGLLHDNNGERMTPTHANKNRRRYRYYVSHSLIKPGRPKTSDTARRVPAGEVEHVVEDRIISFLQDAGAIHDALGENRNDAHQIEALVGEARGLARRWPHLSTAEKSLRLKYFVVRITLSADGLEIGINTARLIDLLRNRPVSVSEDRSARREAPSLVLEVAAQLKRSGIEKKLLLTDTDSRSDRRLDASLVNLVARAHELRQTFVRGGKTISEMADAAGMSSSYFTRILRLSFLAPDITQAILQGRQPAALSARKLLADTRLPIDWAEQRKSLGFS